MKIRMVCKTPLWTGDVDKKSNFLQSTGIAGSLRWWTEAILRSMDKFYACDPVDNNNKCPYEKHYCPACLIFGATGIRRTFRLNVSGGERVFTSGALNIKPTGRNRGWYLGCGLTGAINLEIVYLDKDFDGSLVLLPLFIASKWGGIGAKTQHGYGVVEIEDCPKIDFKGFKKAIEKITDQERLSKLGIELRYESNNGLPDLKKMFFAKVQFEAEDDWWRKVNGIAPRSQDNYRGYINDPRMISWINSGSVPIAPALKDWLRYGNGARLWKTATQNQNGRIENWLFGTTERTCQSCYERVRKDKNNPQKFWCPNCNKSIRKEETFERTASKINISCAYPVNDNLWEFRIWGWIPKGGLPAGFDRDCFLDNLKQALDGSGSVTVSWNELLGDQTENHKLKVWREFDSSRDTVKPNESDIGNYIQSLLEDE
ncbi:type III-B CRISPR module RAMP protein Cmr1 [Candidatus Woesearchaeota archaeon]|nr:MAG: type III-B CRISPR module RAMP protein Cmr1 [Candidatus Woesearchaeota archaeon]